MRMTIKLSGRNGGRAATTGAVAAALSVSICAASADPFLLLGMVVCAITNPRPSMPAKANLAEPVAFKTTAGTRLRIESIGLWMPDVHGRGCDVSAAVRFDGSAEEFMRRFRDFSQGQDDFQELIENVVRRFAPTCTAERVEIETDLGTYPRAMRAAIWTRGPTRRWESIPHACAGL